MEERSSEEEVEAAEAPGCEEETGKAGAGSIGAKGLEGGAMVWEQHQL